MSETEIETVINMILTRIIIMKCNLCTIRDWNRNFCQDCWRIAMTSRIDVRSKSQNFKVFWDWHRDITFFFKMRASTSLAFILRSKYFLSSFFYAYYYREFFLYASLSLRHYSCKHFDYDQFAWCTVNMWRLIYASCRFFIDFIRLHKISVNMFVIVTIIITVKLCFLSWTEVIK